MSTPMTKKDLVNELAGQTDLTRGQVRSVLDRLADIACREARNGFRIPGLCKFSVSHRKARRGRNPATGETLLIAAHDALKITPLKRARDAVASESGPQVDVVATHPPSSPAATETFITFTCGSCSQEIEASPDLAGARSQCPACGMPLTVPEQSQASQGGGAEKPLPAVDLKSKTIRIELPDEF